MHAKAPLFQGLGVGNIGELTRYEWRGQSHEENTGLLIFELRVIPKANHYLVLKIQGWAISI